MTSNKVSEHGKQPQKPDSDITALRKQLMAQGYSVLPTEGKAAVEKLWNDPKLYDKLTATRIEKWSLRHKQAKSTGVRILNGLCAIDVDVDDPISETIVAAICEVSPLFKDHAPMRFGTSEHKIALFCHLVLQPGDGLFGRWATPKFVAPDGSTHQVEIFGGALTPGGRCSRQFVIDGPHPDGGEYGFAEGPTLFDTTLEQLPVLSRKDASTMLERAKAVMIDAGWKEEPRPLTEVGNAVYDITDASRFDTPYGHDLSYDELCDVFETYGGNLRCTTSFLPGHDANRSDTCWVNDKNRHKCVAVYVHSDQLNHFHERFKPAYIDRMLDLSALGTLPSETSLPSFELRKTDGVIRSTLHNARLALKATGLTCQHDTFHNKMWIGRGEAANPREPLPRYCGELTDMVLLQLRIHLRELFGVDFTERYVREAVLAFANENAHDPVVDMLAEAEASWDKRPRLDRLAADYFHAKDNELNRQFLRKTMLGAVARARIPGCKFDTLLMLEAQEGYGKSSSFRILAGEENFSDESIVGKDSREVQEHLADIWIHESAELAGMSKRDIDMVTAYLSRQEDRARPAYGRFLIKQPRHSIEVGSTNPDVMNEYLQKQTGNRRWWPVLCERPIELERIKTDRLQLWGEAAHYQSQGESLTLPIGLWEAAGDQQELRRVRDPLEDILPRLALRSPGAVFGEHSPLGFKVIYDEGATEFVSTNDLFEHTLRKYNVFPVGSNSKKLAGAMRHLGWTADRARIDGVQLRGFRREKVKVSQERTNRG